MNTLDLKTIGEYVSEDFRTASIFSKYNIDFCCKGHKTLNEVCDKKGLNINQIINEIDFINNLNDKNVENYNNWPLDKLIDYIIETYHNYIEEKVPLLLQYLNKLCKVHGNKHPELFEISELYLQSAEDLIHHMKKEEMILFPYIKELVLAELERKTIHKPHFDNISNPIAMMKFEHETEGNRYEKISQLTENYIPPQDACNTYKITFAMLKEFEEKLHIHIHLENNILFPKAELLEDKLSL